MQIWQRENQVGCLKLGGFEGHSCEVALGNRQIVFTAMRRDSEWPAG